MSDEHHQNSPRLTNAPIRTSIKSPREALQPETPPPPPLPDHKKTRNRPWVVVGNLIFSLLVLLSLFVGFAAWYARDAIQSPGPHERDVRVYIPKGSGKGNIADILKDANVITSPLLFRGAVDLFDRGKDLKWGEYDIPRQASMLDIIDILVEGRAIKYKITIPEGLTSQQVVERLRAEELLMGEILKIPEEGSLAPDTFNYQRGDTRKGILDQMTRLQERIVRESWERRAPDIPLHSPNELLTLASIVEKETGKAEERARVAGVFINRLNKRMRLESDPTIIYGLVGGKGTLGRAILRSEIDKLTAYNTYRVDGLPPGPIANPGRAAIEATANPMRHKEIFFVADGTGGHVFAETLDQHNRNVARWRALEAQRGEAATPPSPATPAPATGR